MNGREWTALFADLNRPDVKKTICMGARTYSYVQADGSLVYVTNPASVEHPGSKFFALPMMKHVPVGSCTECLKVMSQYPDKILAPMPPTNFLREYSYRTGFCFECAVKLAKHDVELMEKADAYWKGAQTETVWIKGDKGSREITTCANGDVWTKKNWEQQKKK